MFVGTDHPFFPPIKRESREWQSVLLNSSAVEEAAENFGDYDAMMGGNAIRVLDLDF